MKKPNLNVWKGVRVSLTIKNTNVEMTTEEGDIVSKPYTMTGLFVHWDGESIHLNELNTNPNLVTTSILRSEVTIIEIAKEEDYTLDNNGSTFVN